MANISAKKDPVYPVSTIPQELLKGADAVIRESKTILEVISEGKIVYHEKFAITILKESGKNKALFREGYNKLSSISDISAVVYDAKGMKVKSIPTSEIIDFTAVSGFSLYEDSRVKKIDPKYAVYPFTVVYTWEKKFNSAYYIYGWYAFNGYNTAVEKLFYQIKTPVDYKYHYQELNLSEEKTEQINDGIKEVSWSLNNFEAPQKEVLSGYLESWLPCVNIAPDRFELDGYHGNVETWNSYGKFIFELNKGRDRIPEETIQHIASMLTNEMSDYEKIAKIYQYSQNKNRYVSIQEGIGGQQPFPAETVDRLSYGDCKALSNYVVSLLRKFGYSARYTLVQAGEEDFSDIDFVCDYFNHIITCVPLENDTIWLECTSPYSPCGYLGDFTDDRPVLLIDEDGGKIVKTPAFNIDENNQKLVGRFEVLPDGSAKGESTLTYKGALYGDEYRLVIMDETDRRKRVIKSIHIPQFDLLDYEITAHKERKPWLDKNLTLSIPSFASKMGDRLFFNLNTMNKTTQIPPYSRHRKSPMMISRPYSENDSVTYIIPNGFSIEALPDPVNVDSEFGTYNCKSTLEDGNIIYERALKIRKGQYPKEKYNEFVEFLEKVAKYDEAKAVLIKQS